MNRMNDQIWMILRLLNFLEDITISRHPFFSRGDPFVQVEKVFTV